MSDDRASKTTSPRTPPSAGPSEHDTWAEHRAALDATLFAVEIVDLELRDGALLRR